MDTSDLKLPGVFCHYRARRTGSWASNSGAIGLAYSRSTTHSVIARDWTLGLGFVVGVGYTCSFGWARCLRQAKGMHRSLSSPPARVTHPVLFIGVLSNCICLWHGHWGKDPKTKNRRGKSVLVSQHTQQTTAWKKRYEEGGAGLPRTRLTWSKIGVFWHDTEMVELAEHGKKWERPSRVICIQGR